MLLNGCLPSQYQVATPSSYQTIDDSQPQKKIILLNESEFGKNGAYELANLLNRKQWDILEERIHTIDTEQSRRIYSIR